MEAVTILVGGLASLLAFKIMFLSIKPGMTNLEISVLILCLCDLIVIQYVVVALTFDPSTW